MIVISAINNVLMIFVVAMIRVMIRAIKLRRVGRKMIVDSALPMLFAPREVGQIFYHIVQVLVEAVLGSVGVRRMSISQLCCLRAILCIIVVHFR